MIKFLIFSSTPDQVPEISIQVSSSTLIMSCWSLLYIQKFKDYGHLLGLFTTLKNANFNEIRSELSSTDFSSVYNAPNVDSSWKKNFTDIFMSIINKHISKIKIKDCRAPAWIDSEIRHLRNKKESSWRRAKKSDFPQTWESFRKLRNRLNTLIQDKYNDYIDSLGATISDNPKRVWSYFRSKTQSRTLPQVIKSDNRTASNARDKAQLFNSYLYSVFFFQTQWWY